MARLSSEEKRILDSYEKGEWKPVENTGKEKRRYQEIARVALKKDRRINIRISTRDLEGVQKRAVQEGIPYQTLISSVIHKYVSGVFDNRA
jgi:predicted DNA binding CopG/RHH family protein